MGLGLIPGWWQLEIFFEVFHPENLGKMNPFLTHIFGKMGWFNHHLVMFFLLWRFVVGGIIDWLYCFHVFVFFVERGHSGIYCQMTDVVVFCLFGFWDVLGKICV